MQSLKVFLITFLSSVCIVMLSFAGLYWAITPSYQPADANKDNIPITKATSGDNKTALVFLQTKTDSSFFTIKLNAVDSLVSVTAYPADYYISHSGRTLLQSFEYAGIMQCVQDLSQQSDTTIDYHLVLDTDTLPLLEASFITEDVISALSTQNIQQLADNILQTIKDHTSEIQTTLLPAVSQNLSWLYTNIGKTEANAIDRILTLLMRSHTEYICQVAE